MNRAALLLTRRATLLAIALSAMSGWATASVVEAQDAPAPDNDRIATTAAGEQYRAGLLQRWILGRHYRDLWTQPIQVELLDLEATAGGLTPTRTGGGMQTQSLRFMGADGREYAFRSVDKDPSPVLDSILRGTPGTGNEATECRITVAVLREHHQLAAAPQAQLGTENELEPEGLCRHVRTHDAGH